MILAGNEFYTPYISAFPMNMPKIDMLIGCNFIRAMKGGIRFEGTEITFYKTVTKVETTFEHIKGENNQVADHLSRLAQTMAQAQVIPKEAHEALVTIIQGNYSHIGLMDSLSKVTLKAHKTGRPAQWYEVHNSRRIKESAFMMNAEIIRTGSDGYANTVNEIREKMSSGGIVMAEHNRLRAEIHQIEDQAAMELQGKLHQYLEILTIKHQSCQNSATAKTSLKLL